MVSQARERTRQAQGRPKGNDGAMRITVGGRSVHVDVRSFSLRDDYRRTVELERLGLPTTSPALGVGAAVWLVMSKTDPDVTLEWVLDNMTIGDLQDAEIVEDDDSPGA